MKKENMFLSRDGVTTLLGSRHPRLSGILKNDMGTKDSELVICKKLPIANPISPEILPSVALRKRPAIVNRPQMGKQLLGQSGTGSAAASSLWNATKYERGKRAWKTDGKASNNEGHRFRSEMVSQECPAEPLNGVDVVRKPACENRTFIFSNTASDMQGVSGKLATITSSAQIKATSPSQTKTTSRSIQTDFSLFEFMKHVEILVLQQSLLVKKITQLKEELHFIINKMNAGEGLLNAQSQDLEEVVKCADILHDSEDDIYNCHNILQTEPRDTVSCISGSDLSLPKPELSDQSSYNSRGHFGNNDCYNQCWNAKIRRKRGEADIQQTILDNFLLSRDTSPAGMSHYGSTRQSVSGDVHSLLQYMLLSVMMIAQFAIQFVTMRT